MWIRGVILPAVWVSLCSFPVSAAEKTATPKKNLTVVQVIEKNIKARGGLKSWLAVNSLVMTGKMDAGRVRVPDENKPPTLKATGEIKVVQLPYRLELMRPMKSRLEVVFEGETAVQIYDGKKGWKLRPYLGRKEVESFSPEEEKLASLQQELDGPLINYAKKGTKVRLVGKDKVADKDAFKIELTLKNGQVRNVWIDAETFLDVKIDGARRLDGKMRTVNTYMKDFRRVGNLVIPFTISTVVEGVEGVENIAIERVEVNAKLKPDRFNKPSV